MATRTSIAQTLGLIAAVALTFAAGGIGAMATVNAPSFYESLERPAWAPPASAFGPVWTALYLLMGIALWLVWREPSSVRPVRTALVLFLVQLGLNALWSWLFFAWREGALAFAGAVLLAGLIAGTIGAFWRVRRTAAALLVPYLAWVAFAAALTWAVWQRNPAAL